MIKIVNYLSCYINLITSICAVFVVQQVVFLLHRQNFQSVALIVRAISPLLWQKSKVAVETEIVNMYTFNPPYPAVRPGCVPWSTIIVCNEKLE